MQNLGGILTIAIITPMLGLLGTFVGLLDLFMMIEANAPDAYWSIIKWSLESFSYKYCSLSISIPSLVAYHYLLSRIEKITIGMEYSINEIIFFLNNDWLKKENYND